MNRKKLTVLALVAAAVVIAVVVVVVVMMVNRTEETNNKTNTTCDRPKNSLLPFCDSSLPMNRRVSDLVSRLTLKEKLGLLTNRAAGASENVELDIYNWSNEALHGLVFNYESVGTSFRPPTEYATVFPQIISLCTSFDRDLFFRMADAIGNEAR